MAGLRSFVPPLTIYDARFNNAVHKFGTCGPLIVWPHTITFTPRRPLCSGVNTRQLDAAAGVAHSIHGCALAPSSSIQVLADRLSQHWANWQSHLYIFRWERQRARDCYLAMICKQIVILKSPGRQVVCVCAELLQLRTTGFFSLSLSIVWFE